jgi:single-stranded-DNA-specific exonuclease
MALARGPSLAFVAAAGEGAGMIAPPRLRRREVPDTSHWPASVHPVLQRLYAARGIADAEAAQPRLSQMLRPDSLGGLDRAVALLADAIDRQSRILVVGDFDADGATGTAVAVEGLLALGACNVEFRVPHRMRHGYGLSAELVADLARPLPDLLLTVDSGINCHAGVAAAKAAGIAVIVSDHHLPGAQLPAADAIVNPNVEGDAFPSKALAGVGVVFYLLLALRSHRRAQGRFATGAEPDLTPLLDLVALGTVADMVPLDANNRILVQAGLRRMRAGKARAGLRALAQVAGRAIERLNAADLGYALAPRVNAAGRLEDMSLGIACLLTGDEAQATRLAAALDHINAERRGLQQQMLEQAEALVAAWLAAHAGDLPHAICVHDPAWHPGVIGLVASRLKDRLHRPVIAFAPGDDGRLRGSARSIAGFHIRDALADVAAAEPRLLGRFGGHAMAAGLTLDAADYDAFSRVFDAVARRKLDPAALQGELWSDGALPRDQIDRALAELLRLAGPWGQGFPEPVFDDEFELDSWRVVGQAHLKLRLRQRDGGELLGAIEFGGWHGVPPAARLHLAYQLDLDDWRDRHGVQLLVRHRF